MAVRSRCNKLLSPSDGAVLRLQGASGALAYPDREYLGVQSAQAGIWNVRAATALDFGTCRG